MNLHQKLVEVRKSIASFSKDKESYGYSYISGTQVLSKIKSKMDELGVLLFPSIKNQNHEIFNYKDKYGKDKQDFLVYGEMVYQWINAESPEDKIEIPFQFLGQQDEISKAFGSGLTYSERYFLLKFFGVPTDDDDPDYKNNNKPPKQQQQQTQQRPPVQNNQPRKISENQSKMLNSLISRMEKEKQLARDLTINGLKTKPDIGNFNGISDMTTAQASTAIKYLQKSLEGQR